eukprot:gene42105-51411_t
MDHHLAKLAARHIETKFIKINAEKAPFFVNKLIIRTIPTVVCFVDGIAQDKIVGFEGLTEGLEEGHEDEWPTVRLAKLLVAKRMLRKDLVVDEEEVAQKTHETLSQLRQKMLTQLDDEDVDLELED